MRGIKNLPKKPKTNNQYVTSKEFNETKKEFIERFDKIEKNMATKDDIKRLDQRIDTVDQRIDTVDKKIDVVDKKIDTTAARLYKEIVKNSEEIKTIKETMATKDDIRQVITAIDSFAHKTEDHERKAIMNTHRIIELEPKVKDHEKRISVVESHFPPKT
ncbi:MAG: hypothetical protein AB1633_06650 [Elusimicrobiota bacterium]